MRWLGLPLGHTREMFAGISYEGMKMLSNFSIKMRELKLLAFNFLLVELRNKAAHIFEICCRLIHYTLYESVPLLVKFFRAWQTERSPYVGAGGVIPEANVSQRDFMPQCGVVGGLAWRKEFESDFREAAQSNGKKLCGLGGLIPWGSSKTSEPLSDFGIYSLQGFDLGLHASESHFNALLGCFALCVEIHGLPDGYTGQDYRHHASYKADNFHNSLERPNAKVSGVPPQD